MFSGHTLSLSNALCLSMIGVERTIDTAISRRGQSTVLSSSLHGKRRNPRCPFPLSQWLKQEWNYRVHQRMSSDKTRTECFSRSESEYQSICDVVERRIRARSSRIRMAQTSVLVGGKASIRSNLNSLKSTKSIIQSIFHLRDQVIASTA